jgi:hypothetical protein
MHDPIEASASTQNFLAFLFICGMAISSRLQFIGPCGEDEPRWLKDSAERNFFDVPNPFADWGRLQWVSIEIAGNGASYETDRGALQDEA